MHTLKVIPESCVCQLNKIFKPSQYINGVQVFSENFLYQSVIIHRMMTMFHINVTNR